MDLSIQADIPKIAVLRGDDWVAVCGVCEGSFVVAKADSSFSPAPHGSFCPDCKERRLIAPGVLHWRPRHNGHKNGLKALEEAMEMEE